MHTLEVPDTRLFRASVCCQCANVVWLDLEAALPDRYIIPEGPQAFVEFEHPTTWWEALNALMTGLTPLMQPAYGWVRRRVPRPIP